MNKAYFLVKPDAQRWAALPLCTPAGRQTVIAWVIVLTTTLAAFVADRGWEDPAPEYWQGTYQIVDVLGMSATLVAFLFSIVGWCFGRLAVAMSPIVLLYAVIPYSLENQASTPCWWAGAMAAVLWWLIQTRSSLQQISAVRALASESNTGTAIELGLLATQTLKRIKRGSLSWAMVLSGIALLGWLATTMALPAAVGRTYQELGDLALPDYLATVAAIMSVLALIQWHRCGWRFLACRRVGDLVWHVPIVGGPVQGLWASLSEDAGMVPLGHAESLPSCSCVEESLRANPDEEEFYGDIGVPASVYCSVHGIDQINSLSPEQFRFGATATWFWDEDSLLPMSTQDEVDRTLLIGYAGTAFTGLVARFINGQAEIYPGADYLVDERDPQTNESQWGRSLPPLGGVLDRIDLAPAGLGGQAIRYQHGRAWFETTADAASDPSPTMQG